MNLAYSIESLIITNDINKPIVLRAVTKEDFLSNNSINKNIQEGKIEKFGNSYVSIGTNLAQELGVWVNDNITVFLSDKESSPFGNLPKQYRVKVGSIFKTGIY